MRPSPKGERTLSRTSRLSRRRLGTRCDAEGAQGIVIPALLGGMPSFRGHGVVKAQSIGEMFERSPDQTQVSPESAAWKVQWRRTRHSAPK